MSKFSKSNYDVKVDNDIPAQPKPCAVCFQLAKHEDLMTFGARCLRCYDAYCRQAPAYMAQSTKYQGDPKAWARRIIDRDAAGESVRPISLRYAREALKIEVAA
jgi:hypothetical protein